MLMAGIVEHQFFIAGFFQETWVGNLLCGKKPGVPMASSKTLVRVIKPALELRLSAAASTGGLL
jgi:hypothetical protein